MKSGYQRRIHHLLNRGETRNSLARDVFHGHRGQLRKHYQVGQENQLDTLGIMILPQTGRDGLCPKRVGICTDNCREPTDHRRSAGGRQLGGDGSPGWSAGQVLGGACRPAAHRALHRTALATAAP